MSYRSFHFLEQSGQSPGSSHVTHYCGLQPLNTLKLEFIFSLNWNGPRASRLSPRGPGGRLNTGLADCIHLPVTDPSLAEAIGDIKQTVSSI